MPDRRQTPQSGQPDPQPSIFRLKMLLDSSASVISSLLIVLGLVWMVGKPAAQDFVEEAAARVFAERIGRLEQTIVALQQQQTTGDAAVNEVRQQIKELLDQEGTAGHDRDRIESLLERLIQMQQQP